MSKTATIIEWENILRPREGEVIHQVEAGQTLHQWLTKNVPGYSQELKQHPIECLVNGKTVAPEHWTTLVLRADTPVVLAVRPFGWGLLFYAVIAAVAAVVAINAMPPPPSESVLPSASPTYDINAKGNQARLMSPIPFAVGYNRHWMDMLTEPWKEYSGNDQYLYQLFCVGYGEFDLDPLQIGETEYHHYQDIVYEVYGPDEPVTLFPDNVDTSDEVAGIELFGPNEEEYDGWSGWYVVVKNQQQANYLACDFACRQGLYSMNDKGDLRSRSVSIEIEYQEIDEDDEPAGHIEPIPLTYSAATTTPQRWSHRWEVTAGRYRIRVRRTNNAGTDTRTNDSIYWEQARAYYPCKQEYPGITKLAVRVRASNNLSQQSETQFNIKGTALVPEWNGSAWTVGTKNRDIAWAFCHAIRSAHGGRLDESMIDLENVLSLHQQWALNGETVSRVFDTRGTLLGALQEIVACGRGSVLMHNGRFYVVRDMQRIIRRHMYTPFMMQSAPTVERSFLQAGDNDSIIVEYFNQALWENDEILCQLPNHPAENPKRITLRGIASREQAWRLGIFETAKMLYRRQQISFTTEMQALNSIWGDRVGVSYWLRGWGQSGEIVAFDGLRATLSDDVELHPTKQNLIGLCRPDGSFSGPYPVEYAGSNRVLISVEPDFDIYTGDRMQRTQYQLGTDGTFCKDFLITQISPGSDGQVSVTAVVDNPAVYEFEELPPPPEDGDGDTLPRPVAPEISNLVIVQDVTDPQSATLSWQSTAGAREFIIEHSIDGTEYARVAVVTLNTWSTRLFNGDNWFRVAGVADAQGDWEVGHIELTGPDFDIPPATTIHLTEPFTGKTLKVHWDEVLSATHYRVEIVRDSKVLYSRRQYTETQWEYSYEQGASHGSGRAFTVRVTPYNAKGMPGQHAELGVRNEPAAVPDNINIVPLLDSFIITCDQNMEPDIRDLRVWGSQTKGFTPSADNLIQISLTTRFDLNISGQWYFRLAWTDVWGVSEVNYSGERNGKTSDVDWDEIFPIEETDISDDAISTPKLQANSITAQKIQARAITAEKIAADAINAIHIEAKTITGEELSSTTTITAGFGENTAGMNGFDRAGDALEGVRFWAGKEKDSADQAPYKVLSDGTLIALNAEISGVVKSALVDSADIRASELTSSTIHGGEIEGAVITGGMIVGSTIIAGEQLYQADPSGSGSPIYYANRPDLMVTCKPRLNSRRWSGNVPASQWLYYEFPFYPASVNRGTMTTNRFRYRRLRSYGSGYMLRTEASVGVRGNPSNFQLAYLDPITKEVIDSQTVNIRNHFGQNVNVLGFTVAVSSTDPVVCRVIGGNYGTTNTNPAARNGILRLGYQRTEGFATWLGIDVAEHNNSVTP